PDVCYQHSAPALDSRSFAVIRGPKPTPPRERRPRMTLPTWTPPHTKMRVFEALYLFNRSFEAAIHAVDQLERLEFFQHADLPAVHNRLEEIRSETNEVLAENIHDYEMEESCRFGE